MTEGGGAQVGADSFADPGEQIGTRPAKQPRQQTRHNQPGQVQRHQIVINRLAILKRNQNVIHERHGQIRWYECRRRREQGQDKADNQRQLIRPGKTR